MIHLVNMSYVIGEQCAQKLHSCHSPKQLQVGRKEPYAWKGLVNDLGKKKSAFTDPASWTVTKVTFPAPEPAPPADRTVPAILPERIVNHCSVGAVENSSRKTVSNCSTQRSLP